MEPVDEDSSRHWAEPGVYRVTDGVYRIPLPMPNDGLRSVNVYALVNGSETVLIDSGWAVDEAHERLTDALTAIGIGPGDIRQFLITHVHRDHYTMAVRLRRQFGNHVALGRVEEPSLRATVDPDYSPMQAQGRLLLECGADELVRQLRESFGDRPPSGGLDDWADPDEWLAPGTRRLPDGTDLDVVATPGHTAGHLVFADAQRGLLFSGDHVLPHITPSIGFEPAPVELPLRDFLDSLRLVGQQPDRTLLPAHGPVTNSAHARVDELLSHHDERLSVIGETIASGASTAYESARRLDWTRHKRALTDLDIFNRTLAVLETAAHLDLLAYRGDLTATEVDGVRHFAPR